MHPWNSFGNGILGRGLSKIPWGFNFIFCGICYKKQKGPRINYQCLLRLQNMFFYFFCNNFFYFVVHHLTIFDALIQRGFGVFPRVTIGNLCKLFHDARINPFLTFSWNHNILGKTEENFKNSNTYSKKQKSVLGETKSVFHII